MAGLPVRKLAGLLAHWFARFLGAGCLMTSVEKDMQQKLSGWLAAGRLSEKGWSNESRCESSADAGKTPLWTHKWGADGGKTTLWTHKWGADADKTPLWTHKWSADASKTSLWMQKWGAHADKT